MNKMGVEILLFRIFFPLWLIIGAFGFYYFYKLGSKYQDVIKKSKTKKKFKFNDIFNPPDELDDPMSIEGTEEFEKLMEFQRKGIVLFFWIVGIYFVSILLLLIFMTIFGN